MKNVFGKQIPTSLAELLAPDHNALVLVDFQNDFCKQKQLLRSEFQVGVYNAR